MVTGAAAGARDGRIVSRKLDNRFGVYVALETMRRLERPAARPVAGSRSRLRRKSSATRGARTARTLARGRDRDRRHVRHRQPGGDPKRDGGPRSAAAGDLPRPDDPPAASSSCSSGGPAEGIDTRSRLGPRTHDRRRSVSGRAGVPTGPSRIPPRNMHSTIEVVSLADLEATSGSSRSPGCSGPASTSVARLAPLARAVIVSAVRTPFGKLGGGLAGYRRPSSARSRSAARSSAPGWSRARSST